MPASELGLRLTDAYRAQLAGLRQRTMTASAQQWQAVTLDDLPGSFARWVNATSAIVEASQLVGTRLSGAYMTAFVRAELNAPDADAVAVAERHVGLSADGRPLAEALSPAMITTRAALGQARGADEALRMGLARASRTVARDTLAAPRLTVADAIAGDDRLVGWRRAVNGNACGACLGAATGAIHHDAEAPHVHDHCHCTAEPVVGGTDSSRVARPTGVDLFDRLSPAEQDALLGPEKATLIRDGEITLADLVQREHWALGPVRITERPLSRIPAAPKATPKPSPTPETAPVKVPKVGERIEFDGGIDPSTGKPVDGHFRGKVVKASKDGRVMINAGTAAKPKWVQTRAHRLDRPAETPAPTAKPETPAALPQPAKAPAPPAPPEPAKPAPVDQPATAPLAGETVKGNEVITLLRQAPRDTLTLDQRKALASYVGEGWTDAVSKGLRLGKDLTRRQTAFVDQLDTAFAQVPATDRNVVLHRGVGTDRAGRSRLGTIEPGQVLEDAGYGSTSTSPKVADEFAGPTGDRIVIEAPAGSKLIDVNHYRTAIKGQTYGTEREVLLPRGARLVVDRVEVKPRNVMRAGRREKIDQRTVYARLVP